MDLKGFKKETKFNPRTILDNGDNAGWWYNEAKKVWPDAYIWMVEGNPHCEKQLKEIDENVTIALLSDEVKELEFYTLKDDLTTTGASYYIENSNIYLDEDGNNNERVLVEKIKTQRLDDLFDKETVFDLIKLDTQGSEIDIMHGGIDLLKRSTVVIIEVDMGRIAYNKNAPKKPEVIDFMKDNDFELFAQIGKLDIKFDEGDVETIQEDLVFINRGKE